MYTHLLIPPESAEKLYPLSLEGVAVIGGRRVRDAGRVVGASLADHFDQYTQTYVRRLGCTMEFERRTELFSLRYREYLAEVPAELIEMGIEIVGAEIHRFQSAPTRARAGYYVWPQRQATATVERVFPTQYDNYRAPVPLYAQNIDVKAKTLRDAQGFNSKLSQGHFNRFLVDAWE